MNVVLAGPADDLAAAAGFARPLKVLPLDPPEQGLPEGAEMLDVPALAAERGADFSRRYVDFIAGLGGNGDLEWWALSLVGRNPLSSSLPGRCFRLSLVAHASSGEGTLLVVTADRALARQIQAWGQAHGVPVSGGLPRRRRSWKALLNGCLPIGPIFGFLRALVRLFVVRRSFAFRPEPGARYAVLATLLNHQSFDGQGRYRDTYFGDLPYRLAERGLRPLVFGSVTHRFIWTLDRCRGQRAPFPILPMEAFLRPGDLLWAFRRALARRLFGLSLGRPLIFNGLDVTELARAELADDFRPSRFFSNLWYHACARGLFQRAPVDRLLVPFENRAWERMLALAARELSPRTVVVGYQHATTTPFHLNFLLGRGEAESLPLPDRIVTMGSVTLTRLKANGFPERLLEEGCALRQTPAERAPVKAGRVERVLVALASSPEEYSRVLHLLNTAYGDGSGPEFVLRPHPVIPLEAAADSLLFRHRIDPGRPLEDALREADALLFASSTLGLEAVRRGVPAVFLGVGSFLSTDPMEDFIELKWTARTPQELRAALGEIEALSDEDLSARQAAAAAYAEAYCRPPTDQGLAPLLASPTAAEKTILFP